jgi:hypothetical protein
MLGLCPGDQLRMSIAIYTFTRALEFLYNRFEDDGWFRRKPWWVGSWMIMPVACGQLLHAFVFDRDCFPKVLPFPFFLSSGVVLKLPPVQAYGDFILNNTPNYIRHRPSSYPAQLPWPDRYSVVDYLATMARLDHP